MVTPMTATDERRAALKAKHAAELNKREKAMKGVHGAAAAAHIVALKQHHTEESAELERELARPAAGSSWHGTGATVDWDRLGVKNTKPNDLNGSIPVPMMDRATREVNAASRANPNVVRNMRVRVHKVTTEGPSRFGLWTDIARIAGKPRVFTAANSPAVAQAAALRAELSRVDGAVATITVGLTSRGTVYSITR